MIRSARSFGCLFCLLLLVVACGKRESGEILIGVAGSFTGPIAIYGTPIRRAFELAAREINGAGGINGKRVVLIFEDTRGDKGAAINVYQKFINKDRVLAILGPVLSNEMFATGPIAEAAGVVAFGTSNTAAGIGDLGHYVFRNSLPEADIIPETIKVAKEKLRLRRVAVLYGHDDQFTVSGYLSFMKALKDEGIEVLTTETFSRGDVDFSAQLTKIKALKPDAIVCSALAEEAANIMIQARQMGIPETVRFIGGNGFNSPKLSEIAGKAAEGAISGSAWFIGDPRPKNRAFVESFRATYNQDPDQFAAQAYDALYILAEAIKRAGPRPTRVAVRDALAGIADYEGATGRFSFKENGDPLQEGVVLTVSGGVFTLFQ